MITKEIIKKEIDHVREDHLEIIYKIIKAFETESSRNEFKEKDAESWTEFVNKTYGCMKDDPISKH